MLGRDVRMDGRCFDCLTVLLARKATSRRGLGPLLAALALAAPDEAAACRAPEDRCTRGQQCCTGRCRHGACAPCPNGTAFVPAPDRLCWLDWGGSGTDDGKFDDPSLVAVDGNGHVYVADPGNARIQEFTASGTFVRALGNLGSGDGQFRGPEGVAVAGNGHI